MKFGLSIGVLFIIASSFLGCRKDKVDEVKETTDPVEALVVAVSEVYSTFDIMDDLLSTNEVLRKKDELLIPSSVVLSFQDNDFNDGDGIEFSIDFGPLGAEAPYGVLCKDQKYRAGVIHVYISDKYSSPESQIIITLNEDEPFYSGNGADMVAMTGELAVQKLSGNSLSFVTEGLTLVNGQDKITFTCDNNIAKTKDEGLGIYQDEISVDGDFSVKVNESISYDAFIIESLTKSYTPNCVKNILSGVITVDTDNSSSSLSADFDPYDDQACDNIVKITINGKSTIYEY